MAKSSYLDLTKLIVAPPPTAVADGEMLTTSSSSAMMEEDETHHHSSRMMVMGGTSEDPTSSSSTTNRGGTTSSSTCVVTNPSFPWNLAEYDLTPIPVLYPEPSAVSSSSDSPRLSNDPSRSNDRTSTTNQKLATTTTTTTTVGSITSKTTDFQTASAAVLHQALQEEEEDPYNDGSSFLHFTASGFGNIPSSSIVSSTAAASSANTQFLKFTTTATATAATTTTTMTSTAAAKIAPSTTGSMLFSLNDNLNTMSLKSPYNSSNNLVPIVSSNSFLSHQGQAPFSPGVATVLPTPSTSTTVTNTTTTTNTLDSPPKPHHPQKKRLERNRESAKLSRRRRKLYLQELEEKVLSLSSSMDLGRRQHVAQAISAIQHLRNVCLASADRDLFCSVAVASGSTTTTTTTGASTTNSNTATTTTFFHNLQHHAVQLQNHLSRVWSKELHIVIDFQQQQFKSLISVTPYVKFILWLTLQNETFFRGGRSPADRLSAARIGEKLLLSGSECVPPCDGMWPLLCNEIALSYDQEEKVRAYQRNLLLNKLSWVETRHASYAMDTSITSLYECLKRLSFQVRKREEATLNILSIEQRIRFFAWAQRRATSIANVAAKYKNDRSSSNNSSFIVTPSISPHHKVLNLYLLAQKLQEVLKKFPNVILPSLAPYEIMKKLSRRPMYEPLGTSSFTSTTSGGDPPMMHKSTSGDMGAKISPCSSKNRLDDSSDIVTDCQQPKAQVTPAAAWAAAFPLITQVLGPIGVPFQQQPIAGFCLQRKQSSTSSISMNSCVSIKHNNKNIINNNNTSMMTANSDHAMLSPLTPHTAASAPPSAYCVVGQQVTPVMSNTLAFPSTDKQQPVKAASTSCQPLPSSTLRHKREISYTNSPLPPAGAPVGGHVRDVSLLNGPLPHPAAGHVRDVSLLNCPLPQDMFLEIFPGHFRTESKGQSQADQYLLQLAEDDGWAIGGFDIEMGESP